MTHDAETVYRVAKALSHSAGLELEFLLPQTQGKYRRLARAALSAMLPQEVSAKDEALAWYAKNVGDCRKLHGEGDAARQSLHDDCGEMALRALSEGKT